MLLNAYLYAIIILDLCENGDIMVDDRVFMRLCNDVLGYIFNEEIYVINKGDSTNDINPYENISWKYYSDGSRISKNCKEYQAYYFLDYGKSINSFMNYLTFRSYNDYSGDNLLDFINDVINTTNNGVTRFDGFVVKDGKARLFNIPRLCVVDSKIDDKFITTINKYFHNLQEIEFRNCLIKKECNFYKIEALMKLNHCSIETIRSFNDCAADIELTDCIIRKIAPTTIYSKKFDINVFSNGIDIKTLFLECNFPNLLHFLISPTKQKRIDGYSFETDFEFLPYSAKSLEDLIIYGKIHSLEFLTKFKHLLQCSIFSIYDDSSMFYTDVTDSREKRRIAERNLEAYRIEKILNPDQDDKYIIGELERKRILRLSHFLSLISYDDEDKMIFKQSDWLRYLMHQPIDLDVNRYYECYFDRLYSIKQQNDLLASINYIDKYKIVNNMLYIYCPYRDSKQIVKAKNFIYASNGIPIIFSKREKPIRTIEEANKKMVNIDVSHFNLEEANYQEFINELKNYDLGNITIGDFLNYFEECLGITGISGKDFLPFGEAGRKIAALFEQCDRRLKRLEDLEIKYEKYKNLLTQLVYDTYDFLSQSEKAYLCKHQYDWIVGGIRYRMNERFLDIYHTLVVDEEKELQSIDIKMNGLYSKYIRCMQIICEQYYMLGSPYNIEINSSYIKQLEF